MMAEPNLSTSEAILSLEKSLICKACDRFPRSTHGKCIGSSDYDSDNAKCYNGPLLASFECGCMFCKDCYASSLSYSSEEKNASYNYKAIMLFTCPTCRNACSQTPRPLLSWLDNENRDLPVSMHSSNVAADDSLGRLQEFLNLVNPPIEHIGDGRELILDPQLGESEVPGTELPLNKAFKSDREISPNTNIFQPSQDEMPLGAVEQRNESTQHGVETSVNALSETIPQTEEVPGTHISFLDRIRIPLSQFQQTEEVSGTHVSYLDRRRVPSAPIETDENVESDVETGRSSTPGSETCNKASRSDRWHSPRERGTNTYSPVYHADASSQSFEKTEEVPATYVSFLEKKKTLAAPKNSRRITTSPTLLSKTIETNKRSFAQSLETDSVVEDEARLTENQRITQSNGLTVNSEKKLCIAVDIVDPVEATALEFLSSQGQCVVVNGVYNISHGKKNLSPFPSILVTHAMPGECHGPVCIRSYQYIRALALGACVIDARWLVDSKHAGIWLDFNAYIIPNNLSKTALSSQALLAGIRFGVLSKNNDHRSPLELEYNEMNLKVKELEAQQVRKDIFSVH